MYSIVLKNGKIINVNADKSEYMAESDGKKTDE